MQHATVLSNNSGNSSNSSSATNSSLNLSAFPQALFVSGSGIRVAPDSIESLMDDPRGVLWMYEEPKRQAKYVIGCDPTVGITGWSRATKTDEDHKTDNAAIEVIRIDAFRVPMFDDKGSIALDDSTKQPKFKYMDLQVAEYAAPIDAVEAARVCNMLGRIYAGQDDDQCELIHESYPGPGLLTTQELLRLGYANLWYWEYIDSVAEQTRSIGWHSSMRSQRLLWFRARRHLLERNVLLRSKWLVDEYSTAVIDVEKQRARAIYGAHDDRIQAANMAFWAGHKWTYNVERTWEPVTSNKVVEWQNVAPTLDGERRSWRESAGDLVDSWSD